MRFYRLCKLAQSAALVTVLFLCTVRGKFLLDVAIFYCCFFGEFDH